jgi:hypothetical protein
VILKGRVPMRIRLAAALLLLLLLANTAAAAPQTLPV